MRKQNSTATKITKINYSMLYADTCCGKRKTKTKVVSKLRENRSVGMGGG